MMFIKEDLVPQVKSFLTKLVDPVKIVFFTQQLECQFCRETRTLLEELVPLSDKLSLEVYNLILDKEKVAEYKIDKIPAIAVVGSKDYGIRFFGIPAGFEFTSLLEACVMVSTKESGLSPVSKQMLIQLTKPIHIKVFVTLTCPYCPMVVRIADQMAVESDLVSSEMIESSEFPHLSNRYGVMAVPKTIINESVILEGALPEEEFIQRVLQV